MEELFWALESCHEDCTLHPQQLLHKVDALTAEVALPARLAEGWPRHDTCTGLCKYHACQILWPALKMGEVCSGSLHAWVVRLHAQQRLPNCNKLKHKQHCTISYRAKTRHHAHRATHTHVPPHKNTSVMQDTSHSLC